MQGARLFVTVLLLALAGQAAGLENRLAGHPSPYLAMHAGDPVHWQEWNAETVARAKKENKLLYVSSGYFACHWCHVMQRESYQNPEIAALINRYFIPVKVDRELLPALDARLIDFLERTQGYSGWPLNVFITPEGYPLVGMVYLPPDNFRQVLEAIQEQWAQDAASLRELARAAAAELNPPRVGRDPKLPPGLGERLARAMLKAALTQADEMGGGFGNQSKFPMAPQLAALLSLQQRYPDERLARFLRLTLDRMASQGLYDHLGGGFFRYTVDPNWQIPHFEKMLYDNALLASVYLRAAEVLGRPDYVDVARETLDFLIRDMRGTDGAFIASLSAVDAAGVEGGYYLWDQVELGRLLTPRERKVANALWGLDSAPDLEDGQHLVVVQPLADVARELKIPLARARALRDAARTKLLAARARRELPKDTKQLAAWNGLALSALARAAQREGGEAYRRAAREVRDYLVGRLWRGDRLYRARQGERFLGEAGLEDYAAVAQGLFDWWRLSGEARDLELANAILGQAWRRFYGARGWQLEEAPLLKYGVGQTAIADGPIPSPSAMLMATSLRVARARQDAALAARVRTALNVAHEEMARDVLWYATRAAILWELP